MFEDFREFGLEGIIFSYEMRTAMKIRTKESGYDALN